MKPIVSGKGLTLRLCKAATQVRANERLAGKLNECGHATSTGDSGRPEHVPRGPRTYLSL